MNKKLALSIVSLAIATIGGTAAADTVTISGASTVFNVVVKPSQDKVMKSSGHTLEITTSNTGKGLVDLVEGRANLAMVSEPMDIALDAAAGAGKKIDGKTVQFFEVMKDEVVIAVHPSNAVSKLSTEQVRDIHTGKIKNWKEVGGKDLAINVYTENVTGGTRALLKKVVLGGAEFSADVKPQTSVKRVAEMVAGDEAGIGGVGRGFAAESKDKVIESDKIERPLGFASLGAPSAASKAVIEAFVREAAAR